MVVANVSEKEGLWRIAAGFVAMIVGLFLFIFTPAGVLVSAVGLLAFLSGFFGWCPVAALTKR